MRIIAQAESAVATVIWRSLGTIIQHRELVNCPSARRVPRIAHGDVQVIGPSKRCGRADTVESQSDMDETFDGLIVNTGRVADGRAPLARIRSGADDRRWLAVERIEMYGLTIIQKRIAG